MAFAARSEGPWGGAVLKSVLAALSKGWPPGLTVLTGDDLYHLDRAQAALLDHLIPDRSDRFALSIVGGDALSTMALVGSARSSGMFSSRRVVFVPDVAVLEGDPEPLTAYASHPPKDSFLIVRAPKLERKRKLPKALAEAGICLTFRHPTTDTAFRELAAEMSSLAASHGIPLDGRAGELLLEVCGPDLHRIANELEKIAIWRGAEGGAGEPLDAATVRELVVGGGAHSVWELADALTAREREAAAAAARRVLDAGDEPIRILGALASRTRALLAARAMSDAGKSAKDAVDAARAWYYRDALTMGLARYTLAEALAMPGRLLAADRSLKSRSLDKGAVLEGLVLELTAPAEERR